MPDWQRSLGTDIAAQPSLAGAFARNVAGMRPMPPAVVDPNMSQWMMQRTTGEMPVRRVNDVIDGTLVPNPNPARQPYPSSTGVRG